MIWEQLGRDLPQRSVVVVYLLRTGRRGVA